MPKNLDFPVFYGVLRGERDCEVVLEKIVKNGRSRFISFDKSLGGHVPTVDMDNEVIIMVEEYNGEIEKNHQPYEGFVTVSKSGIIYDGIRRRFKCHFRILPSRVLIYRILNEQNTPGRAKFPKSSKLVTEKEATLDEKQLMLSKFSLSSPAADICGLNADHMRRKLITAIEIYYDPDNDDTDKALEKLDRILLAIWKAESLKKDLKQINGR